MCEMFTPAMHRSIHQVVLGTGIPPALAATPAFAEEPEPAAPMPPGLPEGLNWTFNFDASVGSFGFADSLYTDPKPEQPSGDLTDNWSEASIKPALGAEYTTASSPQIYGKVSSVGTRTFGAVPTLVGDDASSFDIEDAYIGWRSGPHRAVRVAGTGIRQLLRRSPTLPVDFQHGWRGSVVPFGVDRRNGCCRRIG